MRDLIIKASWFPGLDRAPEEIKKEVFYRVVKYGMLEEEIIENEEENNWIVTNNWHRAKDDIDRMRNAEEKKKNFGKTVGRKSKADPIAVWRYCQEHPKCKVDEIGEALDLPLSNAAKGPYSYLYENEGWKNRKDANWLNNFSSNEFLEKIPEKEFQLENNLEETGKNGWNF